MVHKTDILQNRAHKNISKKIFSIQWQLFGCRRMTALFLFWILASEEAFKHCEQEQVVFAGIGYSFQLAITAPRINLIGYGTATAQS